MEGFAAAHHKRAAGVTTLQALAWKTGVCNALVAPMLDARRGDIYGALYRRVRTTNPFDTLIEEQPPVVLKPAEWLATLPQEPLIFCGDGALLYRSLLEHVQWRLETVDLYLASTVAEMAADPNVGPLAPLYVRKPDAEIARESVGSTNS
jgi:tRNA threonylcarbamoyladenosine biosynthesis protein TsaB